MIHKGSCPASVSIIRHGRSKFNHLNSTRKADPKYIEFTRRYHHDPADPETVALAQEIRELYQLEFSDYNTPLTDGAEGEAIATGRALSQCMILPDVIYVSPYVRTIQTLEAIKLGWPELATLPVSLDIRLREQEHGMVDHYHDWRVFFTLHPEQRILRERQGRYLYRYPQGENIPDVQTRLELFHDGLCRNHAGENVLVVAHHLVIIAYRMILEGFDPTEFMRIDEEEKPVNCGITTFTAQAVETDPERSHLVLDSYNSCYYN